VIARCSILAGLDWHLSLVVYTPRKGDKEDIWCSVPPPGTPERFTFGSFPYKKGDILFGIG